MAKAATKKNVIRDMQDLLNDSDTPTIMSLDALKDAVVEKYDAADETAVGNLVVTLAMGDPTFSYNRKTKKVKLSKWV
jgi:hypothetical protein